MINYESLLIYTSILTIMLVVIYAIILYNYIHNIYIDVDIYCKLTGKTPEEYRKWRKWRDS